MFSCLGVLRRPNAIHYIIESEPLDMASLDTLDEQQLRTICRDCKIDNVSSVSKVSFSLTFEKTSV